MMKQEGAEVEIPIAYGYFCLPAIMRIAGVEFQI